MGFEDKVAFVTGASQGIGRACALALADAGASVVLAARNVDNLNKVAQEIGQRNGSARTLAVSLDVASEEAIKRVFEKASEQFGKIDILVNNAGITRDGLIMRMKREAWDAVMNTNLTA